MKISHCQQKPQKCLLFGRLATVLHQNLLWMSNLRLAHCLAHGHFDTAVEQLLTGSMTSAVLEYLPQMGCLLGQKKKDEVITRVDPRVTWKGLKNHTFFMGQGVNGNKRRRIEGGSEGKVWASGEKEEGTEYGWRKLLSVLLDQAGFVFSREGFRACESLIVSEWR